MALADRVLETLVTQIVAARIGCSGDGTIIKSCCASLGVERVHVLAQDEGRIDLST